MVLGCGKKLVVFLVLMQWKSRVKNVVYQGYLLTLLNAKGYFFTNFLIK